MDSLELVVGQNVRLLDLQTTATLKIYSTRVKLLCFSNVVSAVVCQANGAQKLAVDRAHSSCVSRCSVCTLFTEHVYYIQKNTLEEASKSNQWEDWWECALEKMWHKRSLVAVKVVEVCECGCAQLSLTSWTVAVHFGALCRCTFPVTGSRCILNQTQGAYIGFWEKPCCLPLVWCCSPQLHTHTHTHTHRHTHTHLTILRTYTHTLIHTHSHTPHNPAQAHTYKHMHTHIHTHTHTHTHTSQSCTDSLTHMEKHTDTHGNTHTYIYTYTAWALTVVSVWDCRTLGLNLIMLKGSSGVHKGAWT